MTWAYKLQQETLLHHKTKSLESLGITLVKI
jgi:hypothetical protein